MPANTKEFYWDEFKVFHMYLFSCYQIKYDKTNVKDMVHQNILMFMKNVAIIVVYNVLVLRCISAYV